MLLCREVTNHDTEWLGPSLRHFWLVHDMDCYGMSCGFGCHSASCRSVLTLHHLAFNSPPLHVTCRSGLGIAVDKAQQSFVRSWRGGPFASSHCHADNSTWSRGEHDTSSACSGCCQKSHSEFAVLVGFFRTLGMALSRSRKKNFHFFWNSGQI